MNSIIVSDENLNIIEALKKYGFNIIKSECIDELLPFESKHSDIQCLRIDDVFFVAKKALEILQEIDAHLYISSLKI